MNPEDKKLPYNVIYSKLLDLDDPIITHWLNRLLNLWKAGTKDWPCRYDKFAAKTSVECWRVLREGLLHAQEQRRIKSVKLPSEFNESGYINHLALLYAMPKIAELWWTYWTAKQIAHTILTVAVGSPAPLEREGRIKVDHEAVVINHYYSGVPWELSDKKESFRKMSDFLKKWKEKTRGE